MKVHKNKGVFKKVDKAITATGIKEYINQNGLKTVNGCLNCDGEIGATPDCYSCLVSNNEVRRKLAAYLFDCNAKELYLYQDMLEMKFKDEKTKRLNNIIESYICLMYY